MNRKVTKVISILLVRELFSPSYHKLLRHQRYSERAREKYKG